MAKKDNRIGSKPLKITLVWPLYEYLDRAIQLGFYGATHTAAAERMIEEHIKHLISNKKIKELTADELAALPRNES